MRRWLEEKGFVQCRDEARTQEQQKRKEETVSKVAAIFRQFDDIMTTARVIRARYPDLPSSESYLRKILVEEGYIEQEQREFNLVPNKSKKRFSPAFDKYSEDYKVQQQNKDWREQRKGQKELAAQERRRRMSEKKYDERKMRRKKP